MQARVKNAKLVTGFDQCTILVSSIPPADCNQKTLVQIFAKHGLAVASVQVRERQPPEASWALVTFTTRQGLVQALGIRNHQVSLTASALRPRITHTLYHHSHHLSVCCWGRVCAAANAQYGRHCLLVHGRRWIFSHRIIKLCLSAKPSRFRKRSNPPVPLRRCGRLQGRRVMRRQHTGWGCRRHKCHPLHLRIRCRARCVVSR